MASTPPGGGPVAALRREQQKKLSVADLRSAGPTPGLVIRKIRGQGRGADSPAARKKFTCGLTIQDDFTNNDEFRRQDRGGGGGLS